MRITIRDELISPNLVVLVLIVIVAVFPSSVLRLVLGVPFLLFFPGYALIAALFPRRDALGGVERLALSFAGSLALVPLTGLVVNSLPGLRLEREPILYSGSLVILVVSAIGWRRRHRLPAEDRFSVKFHLRLPARPSGRGDRAMLAIMMVAVAGAAVSILPIAWPAEWTPSGTGAQKAADDISVARLGYP